MKVLGVAALVGVACAQSTSLPTVDLGYEIYRATGFNVWIVAPFYKIHGINIQ